MPIRDLSPRSVRVKLDGVSWETGSQILQRLCKVLIIPLSEHQVLLANDTEENRRDLTRMSLRTFYAGRRHAEGCDGADHCAASDV